MRQITIGTGKLAWKDIGRLEIQARPRMERRPYCPGERTRRTLKVVVRIGNLGMGCSISLTPGQARRLASALVEFSRARM